MAGLVIHSIEQGYLLIEKPHGLLAQPGRGPDQQDSVKSRLARALPWVELVHRLDRDTSGLLLVATDPEIHRQLSQLFERRQIEKTYEALCEGVPTGHAGSLTGRIARASRSPPRYDFHPEGRMAVTLWARMNLEPFGARLCLWPLTGRSHQLRVSLKALGHPVLGDPLYGEEFPPVARLMLHARGLRFRCPVTRSLKAFHSQCPF